MVNTQTATFSGLLTIQDTDGFKLSPIRRGSPTLSLLDKANRKDEKRTLTAERVRAFRARQREAIISRATGILGERNGLGEHEVSDKADAVRIAVNKELPHTSRNAKLAIIDALTTKFGGFSRPTGKKGKPLPKVPTLETLSSVIEALDVHRSMPRYTRGGQDRLRSNPSIRLYTDERMVPTCHYTDSRAIMPTCKASQKSHAERYVKAGCNGVATLDTRVASSVLVVDGNTTRTLPLQATHHVRVEMSKLYKQLADVRLGVLVPRKAEHTKPQAPVTLFSQYGVVTANGYVKTALQSVR